MPGNIDLEIWKGDTLRRTLRFKSGGAPQELGDAQIRLSVKTSRSAYSKILEHRAIAVGEVELYLTPEETSKLPIGSSGRYEIDWIKNGDITTVLTGALIVKGI